MANRQNNHFTPPEKHPVAEAAPESGYPESDPRTDGPERRAAHRDAEKTDWVTGVRIVDTTPRGYKEITFLGKPRRRSFVILEEVLYQAKGEKKVSAYWAKSVRETDKEIRYIDAQARLVLHLRKMSIRGIWQAKHFLEIAGSGNETYKMILSERFPPGKTLFQRLCRNCQGGIPEADAIDTIMKVGKTVQQLHEAGVFHWDLSAKNIWITDRRDTILFDWDFAFRSTEEFLGRELWRCGTPHYLSQERLDAMEKGGESAECTLPTDAFAAHEVYALISILVHMLIGNEFLKYGNHFGLPYNEHASLGQRMREKPGAYGSMSPWLRELFSEALIAGKSQFATVRDFRNALKSYHP